ncbi:MAG: NAD(P)/FAD-dependent oxidoreductase [Terriglobales bacterium]
MVKALFSTDVFVCGGGPAGLSAAIALRQRGFDVTVADCFRPHIDKACGEGLMPDSVAALRGLGVSLDGLDNGSFRGIRFIGPEHSSTAEFPSGSGVGVRRTVLHDALCRRAQELGIRTLWETRVNGIGRDLVRLDDGNVRCRWIVGADGNHSRVRKWAGLDCAGEHSCRIGVRRHFAIRPWSEYVEIYWGERSQMYVTPISRGEVCIASISRRRFASFDAALQDFPQLRARIGNAQPTTPSRGAPTFTRKLRLVAAGNVALIGEASGSCDAITGEGLAMAFRQAVALADALASNELAGYEREHRHIATLPHMMARAMLLMDASDWIRTRALRAFDAKPHLFQRLLSLHVGGHSIRDFGIGGAISLGWNLLAA